MSYRFKRMLVLFDLPSVTNSDLKEYRKFRKFLIENGFSMLQESVYSKLLLHNTASMSMVEKLEKNKPENGSVCMLIITEKQYQKMILLIGELKGTFLETDERFVVL